MLGCMCVCVFMSCLGEQTFFLPGPPSCSLLGMGSEATDGERREDTKEDVRHCQDPKEEGWRALAVLFGPRPVSC